MVITNLARLAGWEEKISLERIHITNVKHVVTIRIHAGGFSLWLITCLQKDATSSNWKLTQAPPMISISRALMEVIYATIYL